MGRILFFVLLALAIYVVWRWLQRRNARPDSSTAEGRPLQAMVSCSTCGLHIPLREALPLGDRYFCCEEHRRHPPAV